VKAFRGWEEETLQAVQCLADSLALACGNVTITLGLGDTLRLLTEKPADDRTGMLDSGNTLTTLYSEQCITF